MRSYSLDFRQKAVSMYEKLGSYNAVSKQLGVHHSWVKNMVTRLATTGSLADDCSKRGRKVKIDDHGRALLTSWLDEDNDLRLGDMLERLVEEGYDCLRLFTRPSQKCLQKSAKDSLSTADRLHNI